MLPASPHLVMEAMIDGDAGPGQPIDPPHHGLEVGAMSVTLQSPSELDENVGMDHLVEESVDGVREGAILEEGPAKADSAVAGLGGGTAVTNASAKCHFITPFEKARGQ